MYEKSTAYIILSKLESIPQKAGIKQEPPLSPFLFNTVLEVIAGTIRQKKEAKRLLIGEEVKLSLFPDGMKLLIKNSKISETHRNNKKISIWQDTESTYIINIFSICQPQTYKDIIDTYLFTVISKTSKYLGINLIKEVKDPSNKKFKPFKK